ncbi:hypothetical protein MLD38_021112 [Melastoma candidum]|uniref:Uncharacterized protein n=1 Tax=Melastoma candidum TaxID=119954 RepID=A0ACB9QN58_9MYRT|nr:hypothetical protein MLD38_021112 [Melastoma candidum]
MATMPDEEGGSERETIKHVSHEHPLAACSVKRECRFECSGCKRPISGLTYACYDCWFVLHKECANLAPTVEHPFHTAHALNLISDQEGVSKCAACKKAATLFYCCDECQYRLDVSFAMATLTTENQTEGEGCVIRHLAHEHELACFHVKSEIRARCAFCSKFLSSGQVYGCPGCGFFLHEACAGDPAEIDHPFHPEHSHPHLPSRMEHPFHPLHQLTRTPPDARAVFTCSACNVDSNTLAFFCLECPFHLDSSCSLKKPDFKHPLHEHELAYFCETEELKCNSCGDSCNLDLYRCVLCNFNLHRTCLELPMTVNHIKHEHPLTLYDKYLEDDTGEYYCEICVGLKKRRSVLY